MHTSCDCFTQCNLNLIWNFTEKSASQPHLSMCKLSILSCFLEKPPLQS